MGLNDLFKAHSGAIVGAPVSRDVSDLLTSLHLPKEGREESPHITLVFLADDAGDLTEVEKNKLYSSISEACEKVSPLKAKIQGFGKFIQEGRVCWWAAVDALGLAELRTNVAKACATVVDLPSKYDFTPHMTLVYIKDGEPAWLPPTDIQAADLPHWKITHLFLAIAGEHMYIPLAGKDEDMDKAELVIDLAKGRHKGVPNKKHKYLMRFMGLDGQWVRVYPDDKDGTYIEQDMDPETGQVVKQGGYWKLNRSAADIINEALFGKVEKDKHGNEVVKTQGILTRWERVLQKLPPGGREVRQWAKEKQVGGTKFKAVPNTLGYTALELHPSLNRLGYKVPAKIKAFLLDAEQAKEARKKIPGSGIAMGRSVEEPGAAAAKFTGKTDKPKVVKVPVVATPAIDAGLGVGPSVSAPRSMKTPQPRDEMSISREQMLDLPVTQRADTGVPEWLMDKFDVPAPVGEGLDYGATGQQLLQDWRQNMPATLSLEMGTYNPFDRKQTTQLTEEWAGAIRGIAQKAADAFKITRIYQDKSEEDASNGTGYWSKHSKAHGFINTVVKELAQRGVIKLLELARNYKPDQEHAGKRFDKLANRAIRNTLLSSSKKQLDVSHESADFADVANVVDTEDQEEAARKLGRQIELQPDEATELSLVTGPGQASLMRVVLAPDFPEAERRAVLARLWLDSPEAMHSEEALIARRKKARGEAGSTPRDTGALDKFAWMRNWTGKNGVVNALAGDWTDPETGNRITLSKLSEKQQGRYLNKWYEAGLQRIIRKLSVSAGHPDAPKDTDYVGKIKYGHGKELPGAIPARTEAGFSFAGATDEQIATALYNTAVGGDPRVLTHEGQIVQRWLELEHKLAAANRRRFTDREKHETRVMVHDPAADVHERHGDRVGVSTLATNALAGTLVSAAGGDRRAREVARDVKLLPFTHKRARALTQQEVPPSVAFFADTKNQELARRLGMSKVGGLLSEFGHTNNYTGKFIVHPRDPNLLPPTRYRSLLQMADRYHANIMRVRSLSTAKLDQEIKESQARIKLLQGLIGTLGPMDALHAATVEHHNARDRAAAMVARENEITREGKRSGASDQMIAERVAKVYAPHTRADVEAEYNKKWDALGKEVAKVMPHYPPITDAYLAMKEAPLPEHLVEHKAAVANILADELSSLELSKYEKERRAATAKSNVVIDLSAFALAKALVGYDRAIGQLYRTVREPS